MMIRGVLPGIKPGTAEKFYQGVYDTAKRKPGHYTIPSPFQHLCGRRKVNQQEQRRHELFHIAVGLTVSIVIATLIQRLL